MASRPTASSASSRGRRHPRLPPLLRLPPHIDPELNDSLWFDSPASEFRGIYSGPFDLEWIRGLERDERKRYVIGLCNWHMFANNFIRGPEFADRSEWVTVIESTATIGNLEIKARIGGHEEFVGDPKYYEENPELSENPPHELLAEYHRPWPVLEHDKYGPESANRDLVKAEYLLEILNESWDNWSAVRHKERVNKVAEKAEIAISKIPNPERINKVVCIALGALASHIVEPATNRFERWRYRFQSGSIAQHMLAAATARVIQQKTRQPVKLYSSDPRYGIQHQRALAAFPAFSFTLLDPRWGRHEAFTLIDDSTVVIELSAYFCPTLDLIQSYARPVAIITERPFYQEDLDLSKFPAGTKVGVGSSAKWYDVKITDPDGNERYGPTNETTYCPNVRDA
ncbi:hypothetical protein F4778DRAFT_101042 [Xylariomycetidae sp. FL2044]|nr:hypothetical protein F4778DRAFT_101042 [Xylariomycetidae sp. FL2044]